MAQLLSAWTEKWSPRITQLSGVSWTVILASDSENDPPFPKTDGTSDRADSTASQGRVLVVEDEALVAWEISELLGGLGYEICGVAATADEAIRIAAERRPDLILMDVTLKGPRNGIDAAAAIQAGHPARIVYVTAHSDPVTRAQMEATSPAGILHKPYTDRELERAVTSALTKRSEQ
jgi:two-component system, response regulator PdtaR